VLSSSDGVTPAEAFRHCVSTTYIEIGSKAPRARVHSGQDYWICLSGVDHPIGNFAIRFNCEGLPKKAVEEAFRRPSFRLYTLTGDKPNNLQDRLVDIGLKRRYELTGMIVEPDSQSAEGMLSVATTPAEALEVAKFIAATFFWRSTRTVREQLATTMAASHPNHEFFSLRDQFGIMAAGTLTVDVEVIGLYNLCVRPDMRSKGVGTSIFRELGRLASARARHLVLMCDPDLVPWYSQRGCTDVGNLQAFSA